MMHRQAGFQKFWWLWYAYCLLDKVCAFAVVDFY